MCVCVCGRERETYRQSESACKCVRERQYEFKWERECKYLSMWQYLFTCIAGGIGIEEDSEEEEYSLRFFGSLSFPAIAVKRKIWEYSQFCLNALLIYCFQHNNINYFFPLHTQYIMDVLDKFSYFCQEKETIFGKNYFQPFFPFFQFRLQILLLMIFY